MKIGIWELMIVFIVALLVIGPDKLPEYAKKLGEALSQFKKYSSEATKEIRESVVEPLQEAQRPLKEAMEPINDLEKSVRGEMNDLKKSFTDIGRETPKAAPSQDEREEAADAAAACAGGEQAAGESLQDIGQHEPGQPGQEEQSTVQEEIHDGGERAENAGPEADA